MAIKVVCAVLFVCVAVSVEAAPVESDPDFVVKQGKALKYTKGKLRMDSVCSMNGKSTPPLVK